MGRVSTNGLDAGLGCWYMVEIVPVVTEGCAVCAGGEGVSTIWSGVPKFYHVPAWEPAWDRLVRPLNYHYPRQGRGIWQSTVVQE